MSPFRDSAAGLLQVVPDTALFLNGNSQANATTPDHADLDITGDVDLRVAWNPNDASPPATWAPLAKLAASQKSYGLLIQTNGRPLLRHTADGTTDLGSSANAAPSTGDRVAVLLKATLDVDNGAAGRDYKYYEKPFNARTVLADLLSDTGWTQIGTTVTTAGTTSIHSGTAQLVVGDSDDSARRVEGRVLAAVIKSGIDGTTVFAADFTAQRPGTKSFVESTGKAVSINGSAFVDRYETGGTLRSLRTPGNVGDYASSPDHADLDITGDIDLRVAIALDDWTPALESHVLSKWTTSQQSYALAVTTTGLIRLYTSSTGANTLSSTSSVAPTVSDGGRLLIRATIDVDDGGGNRVVKFYTKPYVAGSESADLASDSGWTQLGTTQTTAGTTSIFSSTSGLEIGTSAAGAAGRTVGRHLGAVVKNGIDGTTAFRASFNRPIGEASFTEETGKVVTVQGNARYTYEAS